MEVKINCKKEILKSFIGWLPLIIFSIAFYGIIFVGIFIWLLTNYFGISQEYSEIIGWTAGGVFSVLGLYIYLMWLTSSLSSYKLSIINDDLSIKGKSGWRSIDLKVRIESIKRVCIGQSQNIFERASSNNRFVADQISSRVTFFPVSGRPFKLDFAAKAFDNRSLYDFLLLIKAKGIEVNINV